MSIKKNVGRTVLFKMVDATDFATPETGKTCTLYVSHGAAFGAGKTVTEIANGWYKCGLGASALNADEVILKVSNVDCAQTDRLIITEDALPNAAADAAGGLPISDAGGLDLDSKLANTNEITTTRMQALSTLQKDWVNAGRLDAILDSVKAETAVLNAFWNVFILIAGTVGAVGNDTTHLHLTGLTYGDDELNDYIVVTYDNSEAEYHSSWITDWDLASELATVATLPFTPQDSVDTYWVFSMRKHPDVTTTLTAANAIQAVTDELASKAAIADAIWDEVLTGATHNVATSAGRRLRAIQDYSDYENGAVWLDTVNGAAGTVDFENGTVSNPSDSIADTLTIAASLGLSKIHVLPGSSVTFGAAMDGYELLGAGWTLALNSQSCSTTIIHGATVSGICTGASPPEFYNCRVGTTTIPPAYLIDCALTGTVTFGSAGDFFFNNCWSGVAGSGTATVDFGAALAASNLNMRHHSGGTEIQNMGAGAGTYNMSLEGEGQLVINANCSATSNISIRGNFKVTNNAAGITLAYDDDTADLVLVKAVTDALTAAAATKLALSAGTIVTGTVSWDNTNATTTVFYCDDITEATADHYNGRIVIFTSGALQYQATDITDYSLDTGEGKFTVTALTEAPADNVTFIIV